MSDDLIDAATLADLLDLPPVLLDVRWTVAGGSDPAGYRVRHLPGARYVDLPVELSGPAGPAGRHPLPAPADLQAVWRRLGIDDDSAVVVYDAGDGSAAVRAWWLLRWSGLTDVRILDGGLSAWTGAVAAGDEPAAVPGTVTVRPGGMPTVDIDAAADLAGGAGTLLDARGAARFRGEVEPLDSRAGHIPGAVNLPYTDLYTADGTLRPAAELQARLAAAGLGGGSPAAVSCGSGITAGHLVLAARAAGFDVALFPGSWSQWCATDRPIATGS